MGGGRCWQEAAASATPPAATLDSALKALICMGVSNGGLEVRESLERSKSRRGPRGHPSKDHSPGMYEITPSHGLLALA